MQASGRRLGGILAMWVNAARSVKGAVRERGAPNGFARDESGSVAMVFGLLVTVMLIFVGASVDISRWLKARTQTWQALDAAVLAGARSLQLKNGTADEATETAQRFYSANIKRRDTLATDTVAFAVSDGATAINVTGSATISTLFLRLAGVNSLALFNLSGAEFPKSKVAVGDDVQANIELAIMLDTTANMAGTRLTDMQAAAKNLIDMVVWEDQSHYTSRVALVPFADAVNVGASYATQARGSRAPTITIDSGNNGNGQGNNGNNDSGDNGQGGGNTSPLITYTLTNCVSERPGVDYAFTDDGPSVAVVGPVYTPTGNCKPANKVVPLSSDVTMLKNAIDSYTAAGTSAGHIGAAWTWFTLSPRWNEMWPFESAAGDYKLLTETNRFGNPKLRKYAVVMSAGEYDTQYCANGVTWKDLKCGTPLGEPTAQLEKLCTAMKDTGIKVFAVGFQISNAFKQHFKKCATDDSQYYEVADGAGLKQAFSDIGLKISNIYLSQ